VLKTVFAYFKAIFIGGPTVDPAPTLPPSPPAVITTPPAAAAFDPTVIKTIVDEVLTEAATALPIGRGHYAAATLLAVFDYEWPKLFPAVAAKLAAKGLVKAAVVVLAVCLFASAAIAAPPGPARPFLDKPADGDAGVALAVRHAKRPCECQACPLGGCGDNCPCSTLPAAPPATAAPPLATTRVGVFWVDRWGRATFLFEADVPAATVPAGTSLTHMAPLPAGFEPPRQAWALGQTVGFAGQCVGGCCGGSCRP
jgi:hypothetical protein